MKATMKPRTREKGDATRTAILIAAAMPSGFAIAGHNSAQYHCDLLTAAGLLHKARVNQMIVRYFTTAEAAAQFLAENPWKSTKQIRHEGSRRRTKPAKEQQLQLGSIERKAYSPPAPKRDAVAVYNERTRYSSRMMGMGRYEVSVPYQRIGEAGFSMSI